MTRGRGGSGAEVSVNQGTLPGIISWSVPVTLPKVF